MSKFHFVFVAFLAFVNIVLAQNSSRIRDCNLYFESRTVTFLCGDRSSHANDIFAFNSKLYCRNIQYGYWVRKILVY